MRGRPDLFAALLLVAAALLVYLPSLSGAGWVADDLGLIAHHQHPGALLAEWSTPSHQLATGVVGGVVWRPVPGTLYQLVGEGLGRDVLNFKCLNIIVLVIDAFLLASVARRLGATAWGGALLGLAWALHPSTADAVAWASDTCDLLAVAGLLGALGALLDLGRPRGARLALAGACFLAALLSKETSVYFALGGPLALLALRGRRPALEALLALAGVAALHRLWHAEVVGRADPGLGRALSDPQLGSIWTAYLATPLAPVTDGFTRLVWPGTPPSALGVALLAGLVGGGLWLRRRGLEAGRALLASAALWGSGLAPAAAVAAATGLAPVRYAVMPMALAVAALGGAAPPGRIGVGLGLAWLVAFAPLAALRAGEWRTELTLYAAEHEAAPDNPLAASALGRLLVERGAVDEGLALWREGLSRPPPSRYAMDPQQQRLDLAVAATRSGRPDVAREALDAFLAEERAMGRPAHASILELSAQVDAALAAP